MKIIRSLFLLIALIFPSLFSITASSADTPQGVTGSLLVPTGVVIGNGSLARGYSNGSVIWTVNGLDLQEFSASTGIQIGDTITVDANPLIAMDSNNVWVYSIFPWGCNRATLSEFNVMTGAPVQNPIVLPKPNSCGEFNAMTSDGTYVWMLGGGGLLRFNIASGAQTLFDLGSNPASLGGGNVSGNSVATSGTYVWVAASNGLNMIDPQTGAILKVYNQPAAINAYKIFFDGTNVSLAGWTKDYAQNPLYFSVNATSGNVVASSLSDVGISTDGSILWTINNHSLQTIGCTYAIDLQPCGAPYGALTLSNGFQYFTTAVPDSPTNIQAIGGNATGTITWGIPAANGDQPITGYQVSLSPGGQTCATTTALSCTFTNLTNGQAYQASVVAINSVGNSIASTVSMVPYTFPGAPTLTGATTTQGLIRFTWVSPSSNGGSEITQYAVTLTTDGRSYTCSGLTSCTISSAPFGSSYVAMVVAVNSAGNSAPSNQITGQLVSAPGAPLSPLAQIGNSQLSVSWQAPFTNGGSTITSYTATAHSGSVSESCTTSTLSCTITGLINGQSYSVSVTATNSIGVGTATSIPSSVIPLSPYASGPLNVITRTVAGGATVSWSTPSYLGTSVISDYVLRYSNDEVTWNTTYLHSLNNSAIVSLAAARGEFLKVCPVNASGIGACSSIVFAQAGGLSVQIVQVLDAGGNPVVGGAITWLATGVRSAVTYGLTSTGVIQFPAAPAGLATVTLTGGVLADGASVSGTFPIYLGVGTSYIHLPQEISSNQTKITVVTLSGLPVGGASVTVSGVSLSYSINGVTFISPSVSASGVTDALGVFVVSGFVNSSSQVTVDYNDGVVDQYQTLAVTFPVTTVTLQYEPTVAPTNSQAITNAGTLISVTLNASGSSTSHSVNSHAVKPGVFVRALLPAGFKNCTGQVLSGTTNSLGQVTLKFCATTTGVVNFKATGAYAVGNYHVYVNGTVPTTVLAPMASTPALGQAKLTWTKPVWAGGSTITKYVVTLTSKNHPTVIMTVTSAAAVVAGLAHATKYVASIVAYDKYGASSPVTINVSVA